MEKTLNIIAFLSVIFLSLSISILTFGTLLNSPNGGLLNNLFNISISITVILTSITVCLYIYNELFLR